jgi:hypothetical protein
MSTHNTSVVSLESCLQLARWLDRQFGPNREDDTTPSDRLGVHAALLVAHELVESRPQQGVMVDVFAAMHRCIDEWLEASPVPKPQRRLIKRRAVRTGVMRCWQVASELRPDEPSYRELFEETCAAVMVAEMAEEQLGGT